MLRKLIRNILVVGLLLTLSILLFAQNPLGRMSGTVKDATGAVIANATVTATNDATGQQQTTKSTSAGNFVFPQLQAGLYTVKVAATGFKTAEYKQAKIDVAVEYSLTATLEVGSTSQTVEVVAGADLVQTTSAEVTNTVTQAEILSLPIQNRDLTNLLKLQAGTVGIPTRVNTGIDGGRPAWTTITQDGISIQDNYIRENALDFLPSRPTQDMVAEFTVTTASQGADSANGSSSIRMVTPSGSNQYHGSVYEFNRNSAFAANSWLNNNTINKTTGKPLAVPFLNQNQFGARAGGPVLKKKLFFFGFYEGYRKASTSAQTNSIAAHDDYWTGNYRWLDKTTGQMQQFNVLTAAGMQVDPTVKKMYIDPLTQARPTSLVNTTAAGDSPSLTNLLNTAGYRFNQSVRNTRNQWGMKFDYELNAKQHFEFSHNHIYEKNGRPDIDFFNPTTLAFQPDAGDLWVGAWRWSPTSKLQNEFRAGLYTSYATFEPGTTQPAFFLNDGNGCGTLYSCTNGTGISVTDPVQSFMRQGRYTDTWQYSDNASYVSGKHFFRFGGSFQKISADSFNAASVIPIWNTDMTYSSNILTSSMVPASMNTAGKLAGANALLAFLTGTIGSGSQHFDVTSRTSGFVPNQMNDRIYEYGDLAFYGQDQWKILPNLTLNLGIKWEYFSPVTEKNGLFLTPQIKSSIMTPANIVLDQNAVLDFGSSNQMWKPRKNDFAPSVGFAWDPFKNGKTAIRGSYSIGYVNDSNLRVGENALGAGNAGLATTATVTGLSQMLSAGVPTIATPTFKVPRTLADQVAVSTTGALYMVDPNLMQPYVESTSFGIQRELPKEFAVEVRYVGTFGKRLIRGVDYNQQMSGSNAAFLADFLRARSNGFLALAATGKFDPRYNAAISGSQVLTLLPTFGGTTYNGYLSNSTVQGYIQQGAAGTLADFYVQNRGAFPTAPGVFLPNPAIYVADVMQNSGASNYNGLQAELKRRMKNGLSLSANYTYSKTLANESVGNNQARFDPLLDNARPWLEKRIADTDVRHVINASYVYELPVGRGKNLLGHTRIVRDILGGWSNSSIVHWQTGAPFSVLATRGTFNRSGRSGAQTAVSSLSQDQINALLGFQVINHVPYWINPSVKDPVTGAAYPTDTIGNTGTFNGQVFFEPLPGQVGSLGRLAFYGPHTFTWDTAMKKQTRINERFNTEFEATFLNVFNHPNFYYGDDSITSASFGQITSQPSSSWAPPRLMQFSLRVNF